MLCTGGAARKLTSVPSGLVGSHPCQVSQRKPCAKFYTVTSDGKALDASKLEIPPEQASSSQWPKANEAALLYLVIKLLA